MTKRELINALEALECADNTHVEIQLERRGDIIFDDVVRVACTPFKTPTVVLIGRDEE